MKVKIDVYKDSTLSQLSEKRTFENEDARNYFSLMKSCYPEKMKSTTPISIPEMNVIITELRKDDEK